MAKTSCPTPTAHDEALRFLASRIDYERSQSMPNSEEALKLDRMRELLGRLGDPQQRVPIVHVAGTKGKGSTSAMIAAVLTAAGHRTGLYTSPHLDRVEERIVVDGTPCSADELSELVAAVRPAVEAMDAEGKAAQPAEPGPTYFEILTAMALVYFARRHANAAVLEVGLGGRLDSTNVCAPCVSVITSISLDHTQQLGDTLAAIAAEKAGIIKPGVPVISGVTDSEPREVIRRTAAERGCRLVELGTNFTFTYHPTCHLEEKPSLPTLDYLGDRGRFSAMELGLLGRHQAANAAVTLAAVEELRTSGWAISEAAIRRGLADVRWPARVEVLARRPVVVLDAAHNAASIGALVEVLEESFSPRRRLLVFATTRGKDLRGMLRRLLAHFDQIIFTRYLENPRWVPPEELLALAKTLARPLAGEGQGVRAASQIQIAATPADAWNAIRRMAEPDDLVCVTGSFFLAAEMRRQIAAAPLSSAG
ncbi:MAG: folylpolyglutamate synthase/dihydrofolate synthase family protein [Thermoguttaceae bacterium]